MPNHLWSSGVREPQTSRSLSDLLNALAKKEKSEYRRGQQSREQHNQLREFKAKWNSESPAEKIERMKIWGFFTDKTGRRFTKAQVDRFVEQCREGQIPENPIDKGSVVVHPAEARKDVIDSVGEWYVPQGRSYPALEIGEGEVIVDPKIQFTHPKLFPRLK